MNHKPIIRGTDRGIWRRVALIPFTQNFEQRDDKTLEEKLKAELPGILNWALDGLRDWQQHGLGPCAAVDTATEEYRQDPNPHKVPGLGGKPISRRIWLDIELTDEARGWLVGP